MKILQNMTVESFGFTARTIGLIGNYLFLAIVVVFLDEKYLYKNIILPLTGIFIFTMLDISASIKEKRSMIHIPYLPTDDNKQNITYF